MVMVNSRSIVVAIALLVLTGCAVGGTTVESGAIPPDPAGSPQELVAPTAEPSPTEQAGDPAPPATEVTGPKPVRTELQATDPTTVNLAAGNPTLVEFFAFW